MKKVLAALLSVVALTSCYDEYVKDYEYSGVYVAYQYDLRSFVVGEGMEFEIGSVLAGVLSNKRDRSVYYAIDDNLVTENLAYYLGLDELGQPAGAFTAFDVMSGVSTAGNVSQGYVTDAVKKSGISALTPLPAEFYSIDPEQKMTIASGRHTGTLRIKADSLAFLTDAHASSQPYYAIGYRITSADADTILLSKSFEIIAVRYENMLFGNYYHGGKTTVETAAGEVVETNIYPTSIPSDEGTHGVYTLTTVAPDAVQTDHLGTENGALRLTLDGKTVAVTAGAGTTRVIEDLGSSFNRARLLQKRKLFLHYRYANADGTYTVVQDTLTFRNRIRDGVNEWQDENPEHYN